jgi:adenylate cyclase
MDAGAALSEVPVGREPEPAAGGRTALMAETRRQLTWASVLANGIGACTVAAFLLFLVPVTFRPPGAWIYVVNVVGFAIYMPVTLYIGYVLGVRLWEGETGSAGDVVARLTRAPAPVSRWLLPGSKPTREQVDSVITLPWRQVRIAGAFWLGAAVLFGAINGSQRPWAGVVIAVGIVLGGETTCAIFYLLAERILRPVTALVLAGSPPASAPTGGVGWRLTFAWTLGTGVPLLGIAGISVAAVFGTGHRQLLAIAALVLAGLAWIVGFFFTLLAARSVSDPLSVLRGALARVEEAEYDVRVPVDDVTEIGQLQAGFNRMAAGLAERERIQDLFGRHVGAEVARSALDAGVELGGEVREIAVLFVDLVGSTALAARRPAQEVVGVLNDFFATVEEEVSIQGGWVNKFEGDAALVVFGAPTPREDAAADALAAARSLRARLADGLPDAGIGVSAGPAVAGNIGTERRFEYTVIGDPVNEAARLCELAKRHPTRLLASEAALERAGERERAEWVPGDSVVLRGRDAPTRLAVPAGA